MQLPAWRPRSQQQHSRRPLAPQAEAAAGGEIEGLVNMGSGGFVGVEAVGLVGVIAEGVGGMGAEGAVRVGAGGLVRVGFGRLVRIAGLVGVGAESLVTAEVQCPLQPVMPLSPHPAMPQLLTCLLLLLVVRCQACQGQTGKRAFSMQWLGLGCCCLALEGQQGPVRLSAYALVTGKRCHLLLCPFSLCRWLGGMSGGGLGLGPDGGLGLGPDGGLGEGTGEGTGRW